MDTKVLNKEFKKLDKQIKFPVIIRFGRGFYYNPENQKFSKNLESILDGKSIGDVKLVVKGEFKYNYATAMIPRLNSDGSILFLLTYRINLKDINTALPKWRLCTVFAINKEKEIYRTISVFNMRSTLRWNYAHYESADIFLDSKISHFYSEIRQILDKDPRYGSDYRFDFNTLAYELKDTNTFFPENDMTYKSFSKVFSDFFGGNIKTIASNKVVNFENSYSDLISFIKYKEPTKKVSKKNEIFASLKLSAIKKDTYPEIFGYAQKANDDYVVLRILNKAGGDYEDVVKIFIGKNKTCCLKKTNNGNWIDTTCKSLTNWDFPIYNVSSSELDNTIFRYTQEIMEEIDEKKYSQILSLVITNPIIEQLYKSSLKIICIDMLQSLNDWNKSFSSVTTRFVGKINSKEKTLYKKLGLNKYQVESLSKVITENLSESNYLYSVNIDKIISIIKFLFSKEPVENTSWKNQFACEFVDISSLDNKTFDKALNAVKELISFQESSWRLKRIFSTIKKVAPDNKIVDLLSFYLGLEKNNSTVTTTYLDYLTLYKQCKDYNPEIVKDLKLTFTGEDIKERIVSAHDMLTEVFNTIRYAAETEKFKKALKKIKKYEFENETFSVISPVTPQDLAKEGMALHHCVKSYISRVCNGSTNIMFIRKKEEIDKPFFTVEISNSGAIEQIHGFSNCNVEKESDLENFVKSWVKEKKVKLTNFNKIR